MSISRRAFVLGLPLFVGGCVTTSTTAERTPVGDPYYSEMYAAIDTEPFPVPAVDLRRIDPRYFRRQVAYATAERPGTVVVDPNQRFLYLVQENGMALRYGVGVGKVEAFNFQGEATIARKAAWPSWRPTANMIEREPDRYGPLADGLPGGPRNPLGARALYLYVGGRDTLYRIHGTTEPWSIGKRVSSGCIRLLNQDAIDLYRRVPVGTKAIVLPATPAMAGV